MAKYAFSKTSLARLADLHPAMQRIYHRAMSYQVMDFMILETVRTPDQAKANAAKGVGIVRSKHLRQRDGYAHACDALPFPIDWKDTKRFNVLAGLLLAAAAEEGLLKNVRWGGNWDGDNDFRDNSLEDLPHLEWIT